MKKHMLARTNILVCLVIVVGFVITSGISYKTNWGAFKQEVEQVSNLTSEGIFHEIDSMFEKPIHISMTMANDSLLKDFLSYEMEHLNEETYIQSARDYLEAYRVKYNYDSVFLVSTQTNRYYHFNGLDRVLTPDNPENVWYYTFLESNEEYALNIDNDEAINNEITVFINCKIEGPDGIMGVVGVGFRVDSLQGLLKDYEQKFDGRAFLVDGAGNIEISSDRTGYASVNLFDEDCPYLDFKDRILSNQEQTQDFWYTDAAYGGYLVTKYAPVLEWHLIIDYDTTELLQQLQLQFGISILIMLAVIVVVLLAITGIIRTYNKKIIELTVVEEKHHKSMLQKSMENLYEDIYEIDITHKRAASEATEQYFESLGVPKNVPYDQALSIIAEKQIKEEFRQGYLDTFSPDNVRKAYEDGIENLRYDFLISPDGENYYWMRITAYIFYWANDQSIRMLVYRQNVDGEKRRELYLLDQMQKDSLTGLYNKASTQENIQQRLTDHPNSVFAFFILDIDNFKQVNDRFGHAMGDTVLLEFAQTLQSQFREGDIVGRIGGDEFIALLPVPDETTAEEIARRLIDVLGKEVQRNNISYRISASIGIAFSPKDGADFSTLYQKADAALYRAKKAGKNNYRLFDGKLAMKKQMPQ